MTNTDKTMFQSIQKWGRANRVGGPNQPLPSKMRPMISELGPEALAEMRAKRMVDTGPEKEIATPPHRGK